MDKAVIEQILKDELGYSDYEAEVTAQDLLNLQPQLQPALQDWIASRKTADVAVGEFSAILLMEKKNFTYPAALIALDWLLIDPQTASVELHRNLRK